MLVVGLTGGIASGKSTVSRLLVERYHLTVIDLDILAREVVEPGQPAYHDIVNDFGSGILVEAQKEGPPLPADSQRSIDRKKLGAIVFNDKAKLSRLNRYTHPRIYQRALWLILVAWFRGEKVIYLDVPLLIETGMWKRVGKVLLVYTSEACQLDRLVARDGKGDEDARARLRNQMSMNQKVPFADHVLNNSGDQAALEEQVHHYLKALASRYSDLNGPQASTIDSDGFARLHTAHFTDRSRPEHSMILSGLLGGLGGLQQGLRSSGFLRLWFWLWVIEWLFPPAGVMAAGISILWRTLFRSPDVIAASKRLREERDKSAASVQYQQQKSSESLQRRRPIGNGL